jgi:Domain of unknown function (DUF5916)
MFFRCRSGRGVKSCDPHPALRAPLSQGERDNFQANPSPTGRGEAPGEGRRALLTNLIFALAICLTTTLSAFSQRPADAIDYETARLSRIATAIRATEKISLDGRLEEPSWKLAIPATDFIQQRPHAGELATQRTEARFVYDDNNLYVGVTCFDSEPEGIVVNSLQRDYPTQESDGITLIIDSLHDRRSGFTFVTNPAGARRDQQLSNDGQGNLDWDGIWDVKTSRNGEGWIAEYMIPFTTLRFSTSPSQEWGLQITRRIPRLNEEAHWAPLPQRYGNFHVSLAGTLKGLENIHQGRNLRVKPFVSAGITQSRGPDGRMQTVQSLGRLKDYDGGADLKYSITPSLTLDATYHTDFAQVEADQQQVNLTRFNLFFPEKRDFFLENTGTFTFGPGGNLVPFFSRRIGLSPAGTPIPIIGGARLTGQINRYDVGFITMKTDNVSLTPSNNFVVGRIKRKLLRNSYVGTLVTNRDSTVAGDYNRVYGSDAHFLFFEKLEFDSYLLGSTTPGKSGKNQARRFETGWRDEEFLVTTEYNEVQPNFNPEVGFIRRRDMKQYSGEFTYKPLLRKSESIHNLNFGHQFDYFAGSGSGKVETRSNETTLGVIFETNASINFVINQTFDRLAEPLRIPSGNPHVAIPRGDYKFENYTGNFTTNQRRKLAGNGAYSWGSFYNGDHKQVTAGVTVKPNYHLTINLTYDRNRVELDNGAFTTKLIGAKLIYGFTPRAFFNAFIQYNADTHLVSSNIRFNWTHHPLSDLYIVYNDTRNTLTHEARERAFIVKLTNLFKF